MTGDVQSILEFHKVRRILAGYTVTEPGFKQVEQLAPLYQRQQLVERRQETGEMVRLRREKGAIPLSGSQPMEPVLHQLHAEGTLLQPALMLQVKTSLEAAATCKTWLNEAELAPLLYERSRILQPLAALRSELSQCIGEGGEILDSASFILSGLRVDIRQMRDRIRRFLNEMLLKDDQGTLFQERLVTERNGRYVVPLKADCKGRVRGFVHDESGSGQTLYLEPEATLEWNNQLRALLREEGREEERILLRLSDLIRNEAVALSDNQSLLAYFDLLAAVTRFATDTESHFPELTGKPALSLRQARHPLLLFDADGRCRPDAAVPVDIRLGRNQFALVISGPNTGGKTVALKTTGLLVLMVACGLPIPCDPRSRVFPFVKIFADIGDAQSIDSGLSTFSGHLVRIAAILEAAGSESLVLMDEAGTGTDPAEGGALALAVIDSLRQKGARVVLTTHLNLIKTYALQSEGMVSAAVDFDRQTLAPTYHLHYGIPGASNAFVMARRLGFPEKVLELAGEWMDDGEQKALFLLDRLNREQQELERRRAEAVELLQQAKVEREKRRKLLHELEDKRRDILEKARTQGKRLLTETESRLKQLYKEAKKQQGTQAGGTELRAAQAAGFQELDAKLQKLVPVKPRGPAPRTIEAGELLQVLSLGVEAEVVQVKGEIVELSLKGKRLRVQRDGLQAYRPRRFSNNQRPDQPLMQANLERECFNPRLLLVGKRVDEAIAMLERFVDDALLTDFCELQVVHGSGEGLLRKAVRSYLREHKAVVSFHAAAACEGGDNITLVGLKH